MSGLAIFLRKQDVAQKQSTFDIKGQKVSNKVTVYMLILDANVIILISPNILSVSS